MWDNRGEKIFVDRLPKFISLQFRPWPLTTLTDEKKREIKKNLTSISDKYREQEENARLLKHIGDIRKKLDAIEAYRERRAKMMQQVKELNRKRIELFGTVDVVIEV